MMGKMGRGFIFDINNPGRFEKRKQSANRPGRIILATETMMKIALRFYNFMMYASFTKAGTISTGTPEPVGLVYP